MRLHRVILALALSACSGKETGDVKNGGSTDGGAGSSGAAGDSSSGGSSSSSGGSASGSGGTSGSSAAGSSAGGESGGTAGGGTAGGGTAGGAGGEGELVSCDHRQVLCKSVEPTCPEMQVASVTENLCWGPCVKIELCACSSADECPHEESYTCWSKQHCGPYVR